MKQLFRITTVLLFVLSGTVMLEVGLVDAQPASNQSPTELKTVTNAHFSVPYAGVRHVKYLQLERNDCFEGSFVIDKFYTYPNLNYGGHGEPVTIKVEVLILDPDGQIIYKCYPARIGSFNITALQSGVYTFATGGYYLWLINQVVTPEMTLNYSVTGAPFKMDILSPLHEVSTSNVSLNLAANRFSDWIGYCLDENKTVTLWDANWSSPINRMNLAYTNVSTPVDYGNTTLTGLSNGLHTITVSANDTYGNWQNQTTSFKVDPSLIDKKPDALLFRALTVAAIVAIITSTFVAVHYGRHIKTRK